MKNKFLIFTLLAAVLTCSVIADYVYTDAVFEKRESEYSRYASLGVSPHALYSGYSIERITSGYSAPRYHLMRTLIQVPVVNQHPDLPIGCEISAAAAVLQYLGFDIDQVTLANEFFKADNSFTYDKTGLRLGPDPYEVFVGDPFGVKNRGYGCFAPALEKFVNDYLSYAGSNYKAVAIYDLNEVDMEKLLDNGVPVIVWAARQMKPFEQERSTRWFTKDDKKEINWVQNSHTLVLCGYDSQGYYFFMDPDNKTELTPYSKEQFLNRFDEAGKQAVVILRD